MFIKRYPELWKKLCGSNRFSPLLLSSILISNLCAALLEGISFGLILSALSVLATQEPPTFLSHFSTTNHNELFVSLLILAVLCQGIRSALSGFALYISTLFSIRVQEELHLAVYQKIFHLKFSQVNSYKTGDLVDYTKIPISIVNPIADHANRVFVSALMILVTLAIMFVLNGCLALSTLFLLGFAGILHKIILRKIANESETLSSTIVHCTKETVQSLQAIRTIHTYNRQKYVIEKIHRIFDASTAKKVYFWNNSIPAVNELLGLLFVSVILCLGIWVFPSELPSLITFIALTHRLGIRLQTGNSSLSQILSFKGSISRLEAILSVPETQTTGIPFEGFTDSIQLHKVSFQHTEKPLLQTISLTIPRGKIIALVGASGSGKSTLLDLILRLYEPNSGIIHVDGRNLQDFAVGSWRDHLGVVSQDISIFNDTIEENIRFGSAATIQEIYSAANRVGLENLLEENGLTLSGGQKQRLALARALVRSPELLILDEATSSLDSESEYFIQQAIETLSNQTILVVAHRLSTIRNADYIYVMDKGQIAEKGTHEELLTQQGIYSKLWERQVEYSFSP